MSTIPEDISKVAAAVWATLPPESGGITAIARAILAERQRCAEVAARWAADDAQAGETRLAAGYIKREIFSPVTP